MVDNEKLLEAARMIKEHCHNTKEGDKCSLSHSGVCSGADSCGVVGTGFGCPDSDWNLPKPIRWTDCDVNMAKALHSVGFVSVFKAAYSCAVLAKCNNGGDWQVPAGLFANLNKGETVQLSDIIAEGGKNENHV